MNRIDKKFRQLHRLKKPACIIYLTVGYPDIATTEKLIVSLANAGVSIFELGMPFSDPLADGPVIQESSAYALRHHITLRHVFSLAKRLRRKIDNPLLMMGYFNPVMQYGLQRFALQAAHSGLDGVIIPDLPIEEAKELKKSLQQQGLYVINFVAPTTDPQRIKKIATQSKGFLYYVSLTGVTGARNNLPLDLAKKVRNVKKMSSVPVCVGFGVSGRRHFALLSHFCDGIIIGSAIIKKMQEHKGRKELVEGVTRFVEQLLPH